MKFTDDGAMGSQWWTESSSLSFPEIVEGSRLIDKWARYDIMPEDIKKNVLVPVNSYVLNLYPRPEIVSIKGNIVKLLQKTHAEIWVKPSSDITLYATDKAWQRQFYPSQNKIYDEECFFPTYRFYMPWVFSEDVNLTITGIDDISSPFTVKRQMLNNKKQEPKNKYAETGFVDFKIKKSNRYMVDDKYGIIDIATPMYNIFVELSEDKIRRLVKEYER